jgi:hypothetical protein
VGCAPTRVDGTPDGWTERDHVSYVLLRGFFQDRGREWATDGVLDACITDAIDAPEGKFPDPDPKVIQALSREFAAAGGYIRVHPRSACHVDFPNIVESATGRPAIDVGLENEYESSSDCGRYRINWGPIGGHRSEAYNLDRTQTPWRTLDMGCPGIE